MRRRTGTGGPRSRTEAIRTALSDAESHGYETRGAWTVGNEIHVMQERAGIPVVVRFDASDGSRVGLSGPVPYDDEFGRAKLTPIDLRDHGRNEPGQLPHQCPTWAQTKEGYGNVQRE